MAEAQRESEADVDAMRRMLEESADVCRAIMGGEVDAFVVGQDNNRRVLLLATAYQRYRQLVERMQQGAVTVSPQGAILYANQRFAGNYVHTPPGTGARNQKQSRQSPGRGYRPRGNAK